MKYRVKDGQVYKIKAGKAIHVYGPGRVFESTEVLPEDKVEKVPDDTPVSKPVQSWDKKILGKR